MSGCGFPERHDRITSQLGNWLGMEDAMTLQQRICGFRGHQSTILDSRAGGHITGVQLYCTRCGHKTKWFRVESYRDPAVDMAALQHVADGLTRLNKALGA